MKFLSKLFFIFCLPGIIWYTPLKAEYIPSRATEIIEDYGNFSPWDLLKYETLSFDRILDFVEMIENNDNLEDIFTEQQLEEIEEFLVFLMRNGIRDWDVEAKERLEEDIAWMKGEPNNSSLAYEYDGGEEEEEDPPYWLGSFNGYHGMRILPAVLIPTEKPEIMLCKGKLKKVYKNVKRAVKKHKKEIIVAAVVVVVATVVIVATAGTAAPEAVVGGGAAIAGASGSKKEKDDDDDKPRNPVNKPGEVYCRDDYQQLESQDNSYQNDYTQNTSSIDRNPYRPQFEETSKLSITTKEIIQQQTTEIKEELAEIIPEEAFVPSRDEASFWESAVEKARKTGSYLAHEIYDDVTDQLELIPQIVGAVSDRLPESLKSNDPFEKDPRESYHEMVEAGHEKIDEIFRTDQADVYSAEGKAAKRELTTGMLPPPGGVGNHIKQSSKFFEKNIKHIFRDKPGHLPDTPANRKLLLEVAGDSNNFLGVDKHGNSWHAKIQKDGTQVWSISRNGEIRDAGVNKKAQNFHRETGLSNNEKPKQK